MITLQDLFNIWLLPQPPSSSPLFPTQSTFSSPAPPSLPGLSSLSPVPHQCQILHLTSSSSPPPPSSASISAKQQKKRDGNTSQQLVKAGRQAILLFPGVSVISGILFWKDSFTLKEGIFSLVSYCFRNVLIDLLRGLSLNLF